MEQYALENGASFVWATHDLHSLPHHVERVVLLQHGRMIFDGRTSEGLSEPWLLRAGLAVPREDKAEC